MSSTCNDNVLLIITLVSFPPANSGVVHLIGCPFYCMIITRSPLCLCDIYIVGEFHSDMCYASYMLTCLT